MLFYATYSVINSHHYVSDLEPQRYLGKSSLVAIAVGKDLSLNICLIPGHTAGIIMDFKHAE